MALRPQQAVANSSSKIPQSKPPAIRILLAGDEDVIPNWQAKKMGTAVPMNMAVRPFLERLLLPRMKWDTIDHVRIVVADSHGADLGSVRPTEELMQVYLTPRQLGYAPGSFVWAWVQLASEDDDKLMTPRDAYVARITRFYLYYAPHRTEKDVESLLTDYADNEELLMVQLQSRYGPEPTPEMLAKRGIPGPRKALIGGLSNAADKSKALLPEPQLGKSPPPQPGDAAGGGGGGAAMAGLSPGVAALISRNSTSLLHLTYLKKWIQYVRQRRDTRRIVSFMSGNMDSFLRTQSYGRWKRYTEVRRLNKQLTVSTKLAYKQESVATVLAEENARLKRRTRELEAQVETLETNSSRRMEALFTSSESAIVQMKLLSKELNEKDAVIGQLEGKLLSIGNRMLLAGEERDAAVQRLADTNEAHATEVHDLHARVAELEGETMELRERAERVEATQPPVPSSACAHCPHYDLAVQEADQVRLHADALLARLEKSETERRSLSEALSAAQRGSNETDPSKRSVSATTGTGAVGSSVLHPPPDQSQNGVVKGSTSGGGGGLRSTSQPNGDSVFADFGPMDSVSAGRNVSFALPPKKDADVLSALSSATPTTTTAGLPRGASPAPPPADPEPNGAGATNNASMSRGSAPGSAEWWAGSLAGGMQSASFAAAAAAPQQQQQRGDVGPGDPGWALPAAAPRAVGLTMSSFFTREEALGQARMRQTLDRQVAPRFGPGARSRGAPTIPAPQPPSSKYTVAGAHSAAAAQALSRPPSSFVTSATAPGLPGDSLPPPPTDAVFAAHQSLEAALAQPVAVRPMAAPSRTRFETGPTTASPREMREHLFSTSSLRLASQQGDW